MSGRLKAIETQFQGRSYRSRLEARWAVTFSRMGVRFVYEPQGYDLDGQYYLPDFYLPDQVAFFEVKGQLDGGADRMLALLKARRLAERSGRRVFIAIGDLPYPFPNVTDHAETALAVFPNGDEDFPYWWCLCPRCGRKGMEYGGLARNLPCDCRHRCAASTADAPVFRLAYEAGLSARFEFGERG